MSKLKIETITIGAILAGSIAAAAMSGLQSTESAKPTLSVEVDLEIEQGVQLTDTGGWTECARGFEAIGRCSDTQEAKRS